MPAPVKIAVIAFGSLKLKKIYSHDFLEAFPEMILNNSSIEIFTLPKLRSRINRPMIAQIPISVTSQGFGI